MIRYGFACKAVGVPGTDQTTLTLARADEENLLRVSRHNLHALGVMLDYCVKEGVRLLRISSDIIPLASHPGVVFDWQKQLGPELAAIAALLRESGVRVSMHPGQYTVLNSPKGEVVERAVDDLRFHAGFLDAVGADSTARIVLHIGGGYGNKPLALERFMENLGYLPHHVKNRLALENDERIFTIEEVLAVCERFSLPAIFDVFHHGLNPPADGTMMYWLDRAGATWNTDRQKIHYSQQLAGGKPGAHSQSITMNGFLAFHNSLGGRELDVMLEVKDKNLSAVKCANLVTPGLPRQRLTDEWSRYKYLVLERSPAAYSSIRRLLKDARPDARDFYALVEEALGQEPTPGHARNAAQHVWGYLDEAASAGEKKRVFSGMENIAEPAARARVKRGMLALAQRRKLTYLLESLYFYYDTPSS